MASDELMRDLLEEGLDDWIPLVSVAAHVHRTLGLKGQPLCEKMIEVVAGLVDRSIFRAGTLREGTGYQPLDEPLGPLLRSICDEWTGFDDERWRWRIWLELTDAGHREIQDRYPELLD